MFGYGSSTKLYVEAWSTIAVLGIAGGVEKVWTNDRLLFIGEAVPRQDWSYSSEILQVSPEQAVVRASPNHALASYLAKWSIILRPLPWMNWCCHHAFTSAKVWVNKPLFFLKVRRSRLTHGIVKEVSLHLSISCPSVFCCMRTQQSPTDKWTCWHFDLGNTSFPKGEQ